VVGGITTRKLNYLSQTYEGKRHDKKIVDKENPILPKGVSLYKDTGFQGYEPRDITTFQPQKKPKGRELTAEQKEQNTLISRIRIVIEHIINGAKRCRIVKDLFRNTKEKYDDLVMEIACGLHNFRVDSRNSYSR
jgi:DDE superfamily endonuclease